MTTNQFNTWITCPKPQNKAKLRLFCLPFAGGGASLYRPWTTALAPDIEVCPIQLPARENRYSEKPITDAYQLAETIATQIIPFTDRPYAIFGHSMGALLAYEVARVLEIQKIRPPEVLFLSAHRAPHMPRKRDLLHSLPDAQFIQSLKQYGGFPEEILNNQEFIDFVLPTMRSDMTLCDLYAFKNEDSQLHTPIEIFAGAGDPEAGPDEMKAWADYSQSGSNLKVFEGGHFFLRSHAKEVLDHISRSINSLSSVPN
jgi:medium-chain acyl-[acyl-carrier-protein] hydrolase